ncbi:gluconokinase [Thioclava indica]|uniref:gluconokinase n=1 Tax=Thioclava indica TaxID=1353528 RepID=UPI00056F19C4|nr:gluconokinase [Thioclava indica]
MASHLRRTIPSVLVMGVCGTGKTTIAKGVAQALGGQFLDADDYHQSANVARMASGLPLDDAMRWDWLDRLSDEVLRVGMLTRHPVVFACSALKRAYRDRLRRNLGAMHIVHLTGDRSLIAQRMAQRSDHFMPVSLLDSQLADMEAPTPSEKALVCDIVQSPDQIVTAICHQFGEQLAIEHDTKGAPV